ncbi:MAG: zinc ABC transporter substrate-binding protein [Pseudomonadota bacterium]
MVTDIAPVHALVSQVMDGVGTPSVLLPQGSSPHGYAMRPSDMGRLADADFVFWMGEGLTPWLGRAIEAGATDAQSMVLADVDGLVRLGYRTGARFEAHDHGDEHGHDDHGHDDEHGHDDDHKDEHAHADDHDDHGHDKHDDDKHGHDDNGHDEHAHDDHGHDDHGHDHGPDAVDPHFWLDPQNAITWLAYIAAELSAADPENAARYTENAASATAELKAVSAKLDERLAPVRGNPYIVFHDAYHYFEARFDVEATGAVSVGDATAPGPRRLAEIREVIAETNAVCVFSEPQFDARLVQTVAEGTKARTGVLDPLGSKLEPGPALYAELLMGLAESLRGCIAPDA